jgi:hypothetical protein
VKSRIYILFLLLPALSPELAFSQQPQFSLYQDIPFTKEGDVLELALAGGLDAPQINTMDVNNDQVEDIILFDRTSFSLLVYLRENGKLTYAPEYASLFPEDLQNWVLLRDFNGDGKKDIFTSSPLGMIVFVNESEGENFSWRLYHSRAPGPSPLMTIGFNGTVNLQMNATDIPSITDLDEDGDLDILVFRFTGSSTVEFHKNMAIERTGLLDSMQFVRETQQWGGFTECDCGVFAFGSEECGPVNGKVEHEGGKSLLAIDLEGDGDQDVFISEETCFDMYQLEGEGNAITAFTQTYALDYPFPAAYFEDTDGDGIDDLVMASNAISSAGVPKDFSRTVNVFRNEGTNMQPVFQEIAGNFLQNEMIDVGSNAAPAFYDVDFDGDLDLFIGSWYTFYDNTARGSIRWYENTGSRSEPEFTWKSDDFLNLSDLNLQRLQPVFADVTFDGLPDLVFKAIDDNQQSRLFYLENGAQGFSSTPAILFNDLNALDKFSMGDVNNDGTLDLIITRSSGRAELFTGRREEGGLFFVLENSEFLGISNDPFKTQGHLILLDINGNGQQDALYLFGNGELSWSSDVDITAEAEFTSFEISNLGVENAFGRSFVLSAANLFNEKIPAILGGTSRGGIVLLRSDQSIPREEDEFVLFPNPVYLSRQTYVTVFTEFDMSVSLVNLMGQEVMEGGLVKAGKSARVSVEGLSEGLYILVGRQSGRVVLSRRLIILR